MKMVTIADVTLLKVYKSYSYTIPSFSCITLKLRHVQIMSESENDDEPGIISDSFFNEEVQLVCPGVLPKQVRISNGCLINVSSN